MLEKIKGYMKENKKEIAHILTYLLILLFVSIIFYQYGFLDFFDNSEGGIEDIIFYITFPIIICLFYFLNLSIILAYKGIFSGQNNIIRLLTIIVTILMLSIIQLIVLTLVWKTNYLSNTFINLMIILLPYIAMILIQTKSIKHLKNELKTTLLTLLITIIVYMLIDIENGVLAITLYNMVYLFVNNRLEILKQKKILVLGYIIVGIIFYINMNEMRIGKVDIKEEECRNIYSDIEGKTGICYIRINGKRKICGKVVKGKEEGKWTYWYNNGKKESEGVYKNGNMEGKWIEWDTDGKIKNEEIYKNGERIN